MLLVLILSPEFNIKIQLMKQALLFEILDFLTFPFSLFLPYQDAFWPWVSERPQNLKGRWNPLN
jgi:hypothetical protein